MPPFQRGVGGTRSLAHSGDASPFGGVAKRIALATRGRAGAADLFENPSGCWGTLGVWGGKKEGKIRRCVLEVLVGRFFVDFGSIFHIFLVLSTCKNLVIYSVFVPLASKKSF